MLESMRPSGAAEGIDPERVRRSCRANPAGRGDCAPSPRRLSSAAPGVGSGRMLFPQLFRGAGRLWRRLRWGSVLVILLLLAVGVPFMRAGLAKSLVLR